MQWHTPSSMPALGRAMDHILGYWGGQLGDGPPPRGLRPHRARARLLKDGDGRPADCSPPELQRWPAWQ